jgi:hypothetical protein
VYTQLPRLALLSSRATPGSPTPLNSPSLRRSSQAVTCFSSSVHEAVKIARLSAFRTFSHDAIYCGVIRPRLTALPEMRQCEGSRQFRYEFFDAVGVISEPLAQFPVASALAGSPMACLMRTCRVVICRSEEQSGRP